MNITASQLRAQHENLSDDARNAMHAAAAPHAHVDQALVEAICSRETDMQNIVGDGGHGRGIGQQDDRFLTAWLKSVRGCKSGTSTPIYDSALPAGRVPTITDSTAKIATVLEENVQAAIKAAIPSGHRLAVAVAGYNAGIGGAISAYRAHGDADRYTTGRDYSRDVLSRAAALRKLIR